MANAYVFPGGRLDPSDCELSNQHCVDGDPEPLVASMVGVEQDSVAVGHVLAGLRETFEEAGILIARGTYGNSSSAPVADLERLAAHRDALNQGERSFASILASENLHVSLEDVHYFAHWITPVIEKRRYEARFFVAEAPAEQSGSHDDIETTDSCWLTASDALKAYDRGGFSLAPPTWCVLRDLARFQRAAEVLDWAKGMKSVPAIMPHFIQSDGMTALTLPGDSEHPETLGETNRNRIVLRDGRWWDPSGGSTAK